MKSRRLHPVHIFALLTLTGLILPLGACVPVDEPACLVEDLVAPVNLLPNDTSTTPGDTPVVSTLTPTFTWEFPAACAPDSYTVFIYQPYPAGGHSGITMPLIEATSWTPATPLLPGTMYTWEVAAQSGTELGPYSTRAFFVTGPLCMDPYAAEYPAPLLLAPEEGAVITTGSDITFSDGTTTPTVSFHMIWDDPAACLPADGYIVQVSDSPSFPADIAHTLVFNQDYRTVVLFFFPPGSAWVECQPYYWRVQADLPGSVEGPFSETRSFVINIHGLDCSLGPVPIFTPVPSATPVPTETPVTPFAFILKNSVCRSGPTLDHPILDYLTQGMLLPIEGRNQDGSWWWVFDANIQNHCWVANTVVEVRGGTGDLPLVTPIPPPAPTATPVVGCWVGGANQALVCVAPCPPNAVPGGACTP
ncbi:MAG: hypothetical protein FD146_382 [Anaerolineaceae bacterium]|nr:MAG: hypothetical protein FD146_382 [Anaerolineaceae bacterium]